MKFASSDQHLGHFNICRHTKRPYKSLYEMNEDLIKRWNEVVKPSDEVYQLGDIVYKIGAFGATKLVNRLNGKIYWITGNHCKKYTKYPKFCDRFEWVKDYYELYYNNKLYVLFHYPILEWNGKRRGSIALNGHSHSRQDYYKDCLRLDCSVDNKICNYAPISFDRIEKIMEEKAQRINAGEKTIWGTIKSFFNK